MPWIIEDIVPYKGAFTPSSLNSEETIVEIIGDGKPFIVEGWLDLSELSEGDTIIICEYVSVNGTDYGSFMCLSFSGSQKDPILRFHAKTFEGSQKWKLTIKQTSGTLRNFPYNFLQEKLAQVQGG